MAFDQQPNSVPWSHYEALIKELEDERIAHADTRSQLMETEDKLVFALGEIEILRKQIEQEKTQFEKTFGVLKTKALKETMKNVHLQNKCEQIEEEQEKQGSNLSNREQEIAALTYKLQTTQAEYEHQLKEANIQMQQELYIAKLMLDKDRKHGKKNNTSTSAGLGRFRTNPQTGLGKDKAGKR